MEDTKVYVDEQPMTLGELSTLKKKVKKEGKKVVEVKDNPNHYKLLEKLHS
jgi:hypothetical protein